MNPTFPTSAGAMRGGVLTLLLATLGACGGSSDDPASTNTPGTGNPASPQTTISGTVVKGPVAGASVCAYGPDKSALAACVQTGADGSYSIKVGAISGDVIVESRNGSFVDEATQATVSFASGEVMRSLVTANGATVTTQITPLTTLAYNAAAAAAAGRPAPTAAQFDVAARQVLPALGITGTFDLRSVQPLFGATPNTYGTVLATVSRMIADGLALSQLLTTADAALLKNAYQAAANPKTPPVTPPSTGKTTASGRLQVTGGANADFTPKADGFEVDFGIFQSTTRKIAYQFKTAQVGPSPLVAGSLRLELNEGRVSLTYANPSSAADLGSLAESASCRVDADCKGIAITTPPGQTHPITLTFTNTKVGKFTLNGSLTGDATGAVWGPQDLPRTTSGKVTIDNVSHDIVWSQNFNNGIVSGAFVFMELDDGRLIEVRMQPDGAGGDVDLVASNGLVDVATCRMPCAVTTSRTAAQLALTFANTVLKQSGFQATGTYVLDGALALGATRGSLTSTTVGSFTPVYSQIQAVNDSRTFRFNGADAFGLNGGVQRAVVTTRAGAVTTVEIVSSVPGKLPLTHRCINDVSILDPFQSGAFDDVPACTGVTLAADGLTLSFDAALLKAGTKYDADRSTASFSGALVAQGL